MYKAPIPSTPLVLYHGTSEQSAKDIVATNFRVSSSCRAQADSNQAPTEWAPSS
jgi:hypothetical protein